MRFSMAFGSLIASAGPEPLRYRGLRGRPKGAEGERMSAVTTQQMVDRVAVLFEQKLRVRGATLADKVRKAGRRLPKKVRLAAEALAQAGQMAGNPRLMHQIDPGVVADAYDTCVRHLGGMDLADRRRGMLVGIAGSIAFSLLVVAGLLVAVLWWRGLI
ncbi:MAG: hypothetical protein ACRC14_16745 [Paracoccaceae bacterium]